MTSADVVIAALRDHVSTCPIPPADQNGEWDTFTYAENIPALEGMERDRVWAPTLLGGPERIPGNSRCHDRLRLALSVRYFRLWDSQQRMLRDIPLIRERIRSLPTHATLAGTTVKVTVSGPMHDYSTLSEINDLVVFDVQIEYHVEA